MRLALAAFAVLAIAGSALAWGGAVRPPRRYQGDTTATVELLDPERVPPLCKALGGFSPPGQYAVACATGRTIVMPNPCRWPNRSDYADLLCHEMAHVNGWPSDHPHDQPAGKGPQ